jgi:hypothetical protein
MPIQTTDSYIFDGFHHSDSMPVLQVRRDSFAASQAEAL